MSKLQPIQPNTDETYNMSKLQPIQPNTDETLKDYKEEKKNVQNTLITFLNGLVVICYIEITIIIVSIFYQPIRYFLLGVVIILIIYSTRINKKIKERQMRDEDGQERNS